MMNQASSKFAGKWVAEGYIHRCNLPKGNSIGLYRTENHISITLG